MYSIDLFSGPGGLCTGFKWAGITPLIAVEYSYWTVQTYSVTHNTDILPLDDYLENPNEFNYLFCMSTKSIVIYGDVNKVSDKLIKKLLKTRYNMESIDIVTGGAPCESFSLAGKRIIGDDRDVLFKNIKRIASALDSKFILFENVKGLLSKKVKKTKEQMFDYVCDFFEDSVEYNISYKLVSREKSEIVLTASDYGVPQNRERLFLIGINEKYELSYNYPKKTHGHDLDKKYVTVSEAISDLPKIMSGEEEFVYLSNQKSEYLEIVRGLRFAPPKHLCYNQNVISSHKAVNHRERIVNRMSLIKQGEGMKKAVDRLIDNGDFYKYKDLFPNKLYAARNRRLKENEPSFTVTSHCLDEMIHPIYNRALTPREAARLQSFPDWYIFEGPYVKFHSDPEQDKYEQIGDAIPPLLAYSLGIQFKLAVESEEELQKVSVY